MMTYAFTMTIACIAILVLWCRSMIRASKMLRKMVASDLAAGRAARDNAKLFDVNKELNDRLRRSEHYAAQDLKNANEAKRQLQEDLREARKERRDAINKLSDYLLSDITSIKFTANIPTKGWTKTEFKLGVGSCGKEVTALHWAEKEDRYELRQTCSDGERKEFTYMKEDIAGRIETSYRAPESN